MVRREGCKSDVGDLSTAFVASLSHNDVSKYTAILQLANASAKPSAGSWFSAGSRRHDSPVPPRAFASTH